MACELQRDANLSLRGAGGLVRTRVRWPAGPGAGVVVLLPDVDESVEALSRTFSAEGGFVVLAVGTPVTLEAATIALEWAADHAGELDADPSQLIVAGGPLAELAADHARERGWPPLADVVVIGPGRSDELPSIFRS